MIKKKIYDLIIVGAGPAGLSATIYAKRALIKIAIFEKSLLGGKLNKTKEIDNYLGLHNISGIKLVNKFINHVKKYDIDWKYEEVIEIKKKKNFLINTIKNNKFKSKTVIISTGTEDKKLGIKGEKKFNNLGVSYCVICDGFLFKNKKIAIIGGGYTSLESALYMKNISKEIFIIYRGEKFKIEKEIIKRIKKSSKIKILFNYILEEIKGTKKLSSIIIKNLNNNEKKELEIDAVFPCIGSYPLNKSIHNMNICDKSNYIITKNDCSTTVPGLFSAGDVSRNYEKKIKQIITAVSDGAIAAQSVISYLKNN